MQTQKFNMSHVRVEDIPPILYRELIIPDWSDYFLISMNIEPAGCVWACQATQARIDLLYHGKAEYLAFRDLLEQPEMAPPFSPVTRFMLAFYAKLKSLFPQFPPSEWAVDSGAEHAYQFLGCTNLQALNLRRRPGL
jgi:hypothetical protein